MPLLSILSSPFRGFIWLAEEIERAASENVAQQSSDATRELGELYSKLERGEITESDFDQQEELLLTRISPPTA